MINLDEDENLQEQAAQKIKRRLIENKVLPIEKPLMLIERAIFYTSLDDLPEKQYLCERLELVKGNFVILCAAGGVGKTMLAQYIACCVASGKPLFGAFSTQSGKVLHIDEEMDQMTTNRRYLRLAKGLKVDPSTLQIDRAKLTTRLDASQKSLEEITNEFTELCQGYSLVILDSLKASSSKNENDPEIEPVCKVFKKVAERANCVVAVIHHKGKTKTSATQTGRGHSSIYDSCDVQIDVDRVSEDSGSFIRLSCAKNRDGVYFSDLELEIKDEGERNAKQKCSEELHLILTSTTDTEGIARINVEDEILGILSPLKQPIKQGDLFNNVTYKRDKFLIALEKLEENKFINVTKGAKNSKMYEISEKGKGIWIKETS